MIRPSRVSPGFAMRPWSREQFVAIREQGFQLHDACAQCGALAVHGDEQAEQHPGGQRAEDVASKVGSSPHDNDGVGQEQPAEAGGNEGVIGVDLVHWQFSGNVCWMERERPSGGTPAGDAWVAPAGDATPGEQVASRAGSLLLRNRPVLPADVSSAPQSTAHVGCPAAKPP